LAAATASCFTSSGIFNDVVDMAGPQGRCHHGNIAWEIATDWSGATARSVHRAALLEWPSAANEKARKRELLAGF
ncbi:MAG TPA: hypothetical protein PLH04_05820, partial [Pseudomonadales bacterium]|nr:hypothetical protein [Pseudomonadales bacterium]HNH19429.1 hypothetical protein [Pseudomonadales bacterium]